MKPIKAVVWQNGNVMVFDEKGEQIIEYQGSNAKLLKLLTDFPDCEIVGDRWPGMKTGGFAETSGFIK